VTALPAKGGKPGDAYAVRAYSVFPTEMAQRLGVTAQAAESVELALITEPEHV
jgi:hypothetical protein